MVKGFRPTVACGTDRGCGRRVTWPDSGASHAPRTGRYRLFAVTRGAWRRISPQSGEFSLVARGRNVRPMQGKSLILPGRISLSPTAATVTPGWSRRNNGRTVRHRAGRLHGCGTFPRRRFGDSPAARSLRPLFGAGGCDRPSLPGQTRPSSWRKRPWYHARHGCRGDRPTPRLCAHRPGISLRAQFGNPAGVREGPPLRAVPPSPAHRTARKSPIPKSDAFAEPERCEDHEIAISTRGTPSSSEPSPPFHVPKDYFYAQEAPHFRRGTGGKRKSRWSITGEIDHRDALARRDPSGVYSIPCSGAKTYGTPVDSPSGSGKRWYGHR